MLSQSRLKGLFRYVDGDLIWKVSPSQAVSRGSIAGSVDKNTGYRLVRYKGKAYRAHRIIYTMFHALTPKYIDHINNDRDDNRIENLRECTIQQNQYNAKIPSNNRSGIKGVTWNKDKNKWVAHIKYNSKQLYLGSYTHLREAEDRMRQVREDLHGEFTNHG